MQTVRRQLRRRPVALMGDAAGLGAIVILLAAALHLPALF